MLRTHALNRLSPSQSDPGHPVPQPSDVMPGEEVWVDNVSARRSASTTSATPKATAT
jgi:hypothetical protein